MEGSAHNVALWSWPRGVDKIMQTHFNETSEQLQGLLVVLDAAHECHDAILWN